MKRISNLGYFYLVSFLQGVSVAGTLGGMYEIMVRYSGGNKELDFVYMGIVLGAVCVGLLSPQLLIRWFTWLGGKAKGWLSAEHPANKLMLSLPGVRTDISIVRQVLAGAVVFWSACVVLSCLAVGGLYGVRDWLNYRFFLSVDSMGFVDAGLMLFYLLPMCVVLGVMLAMYYRLALSHNEHLGTAGRWGADTWFIFMFVLGIGVGTVVCHLWCRCMLQGMMIVWIYQLLSIGCGCAFVLLPKDADKRKPGRRKRPVVIERAVSGQRVVPLVLVFCGALVGECLVMWGHFVGMMPVSEIVQRGFVGGFLGLFALGFLMNSNRQDDLASSRNRLSRGMYYAAGSGLLLLLAITRLAESYHVEPDQREGAYGFQFWVLLVCHIYSLGLILAHSRRFNLESVLSRSLAWARWIMLLSVGILVGWYLAGYVMLPRFGGVMTLSVWILVTLLMGGLISIYLVDSSYRYRKVMIAVGFTLVLLSSMILPNAARLWSGKTEGDYSVVCETVGDAWGIYEYTDGGVKKGRSVCFGRQWRMGVEAYHAAIDRTDTWLERIYEDAENERYLLVGYNEMTWPMPVVEKTSFVDLVVEEFLVEALEGRHLLYGTNLEDQAERMRLIRGDISLWLRSHTEHYDKIYYYVADKDGWDCYQGMQALFVMMRDKLNFNGMMVVSVDAEGAFDIDDLIELMSEIFHQRGGIIQSDDLGMCHLIGFKEAEGWDAFMRKYHHFSEQPNGNIEGPITFMGGATIFRSF